MNSLNRDNIQIKHFTLRNIADILEVALSMTKGATDKHKDDTLVLALGNTGCGKSTMLSSLIFGPENLEPDQDEYGKNVIKQSRYLEEKNIFSIGHSQS